MLGIRKKVKRQNGNRKKFLAIYTSKKEGKGGFRKKEWHYTRANNPRPIRSELNHALNLVWCTNGYSDSGLHFFLSPSPRLRLA